MRTKAKQTTKSITQIIKFVQSQVERFEMPDSFILIRDKLTRLPLFVTHKSLIVSYGVEYINEQPFYFIKYKPFKI